MMQPRAVFQIKPVLPSETDKNACGRAINGSSPSCRTGWFSATSEFLNFSNQTIIKGDTATFVKQCQNHFFIRLNVFILLCNEVWAGCFVGGRTTLEGSPSCGQGIILTSLEHWPRVVPGLVYLLCHILKFLGSIGPHWSKKCEFILTVVWGLKIIICHEIGMISTINVLHKLLLARKKLCEIKI